jgi:hypothetical protein
MDDEETASGVVVDDRDDDDELRLPSAERNCDEELIEDR